MLILSELHFPVIFPAPPLSLSATAASGFRCTDLNLERPTAQQRGAAILQTQQCPRERSTQKALTASPDGAPPMENAAHSES